MTRVCNMQVIEKNVEIGDNLIQYEKDFPTDNYDGGDAVLAFNVQGLVAATAPVPVEINGTTVGSIFPYRYDPGDVQNEVESHHFTQIINLEHGVLLDSGPNHMTIKAADFPGATGTNKFDDFTLTAVTIWYKVTV